MIPRPQIVPFASFVLAVGAVAVASATPAAELSKKDRKQIKKDHVGQIVYARIDIPHTSGRHAWGTYKAPLVEVTPDGHSTDAEMGMTASAFHAQSAFWGTPPNAKLEIDGFDFDENTVEIELDGVDQYEGASTVILFEEIGSREDFQRAFEHAFATMPLQDEHDDWPADIRKAIGERELKTGMTKRQAFYVTGHPERVEESTEGGTEVEIWHLRQNKGTKMGFWSVKQRETGLPRQLRFENGTLVGFETGSAGSDTLDLDD